MSGEEGMSEEEEMVARSLILLSQGPEKQGYEKMTPVEVEAALSLVELGNLDRHIEKEDGASQLEEVRTVGQAEKEKPRKKRKTKKKDDSGQKKRKTREKDDSGQTLTSMLEFNKVRPAVPEFVSIDELGVCSEPFRKQLTGSDVDGSQMRLMLGKKVVKKMMLHVMEEAKGLLGKNGIEVRVYGKNRDKVHTMMFKKWNTDTPVLTSKGWNDFVKNYELKENSCFVTIWMFKHRDTGEICFAIDYTEYESIEKPLSKNILKEAFKNWN